MLSRLCLCATAFLATPVFAKTYVSAALGATHFADLGQVSSSMELAGGWRVLPNFFVEASYLDLGDTLPSDGAYTINISGVSFAGKATLPLHARLDLFAKMGLYMWESKEDLGEVAYPLAGGKNMTYSSGLAWRTNKDVDLSLEYKELAIADTANQQLSLGVTYTF